MPPNINWMRSENATFLFLCKVTALGDIEYLNIQTILVGS